MYFGGYFPLFLGSPFGTRPVQERNIINQQALCSGNWHSWPFEAMHPSGKSSQVPITVNFAVPLNWASRVVIPGQNELLIQHSVGARNNCGASFHYITTPFLKHELWYSFGLEMGRSNN